MRPHHRKSIPWTIFVQGPLPYFQNETANRLQQVRRSAHKPRRSGTNIICPVRPIRRNAPLAGRGVRASFPQKTTITKSPYSRNFLAFSRTSRLFSRGRGVASLSFQILLLIPFPTTPKFDRCSSRLRPSGWMRSKSEIRNPQFQFGVVFLTKAVPPPLSS